MVDIAYTYIFKVNSSIRVINVVAYSVEQGRDKARTKLDDCAFRDGLEPPYHWELELVGEEACNVQ